MTDEVPGLLTPEQKRALREHLAAVIPETHPAGADLSAAVNAINYATWGVSPDGPSPGEVRRIRQGDHDQMAAVHAAAVRLRCLLNDEPTGWATIARPRVGLAGMDWRALDEALKRVADAARTEADWHRPRGRGAPVDEGRDDMIATIFSVYPPGTAKRRVHSHFEQTVKMVLGWLSCNLTEESVHALTLKALRRVPEPPFEARTETPRR